MKIVTIVGARPQFVKAAAVSRVVRRAHHEVLVHTGQHYDYLMSAALFEDLDLPAPDHSLAVGSGPHGAQTGVMLERIERVLLDERPDWVLVYGDTNSTLAGALAAAKLDIPIAHVEAGLRSFQRAMPEEINRVLTDRLSSLLLCPSDTSARHLAAEGITAGVYVVGDVMADVLGLARDRAPSAASVLARASLDGVAFALLTIHRAGTADDPVALASIMNAMARLGQPVLFPVHPRTRKLFDGQTVPAPPNVRAVDPLRYIEMVAVTAAASVVFTDSGGLQKEAYWLGVPCVTLRNETEWVETVDAGWNVLAGTDPSRIAAAAKVSPPAARPALYGDGQAASRCLDALERASVSRVQETAPRG